MMKRSYLILLIVYALLCYGCVEEAQEANLVVEARIENDGHPVVMLHKSITFDVNDWDLDIEEMLVQKVVNWGTVEISDGEQTVVLTGRLDSTYLPPYIYTTAKMKGQIGKTYTIRAEYEGQVVEGQTTITPPATFRQIKVIHFSEDKVRVYAQIADTLPAGTVKYGIFSHLLHERQFALTELGAFVKTDNDSIIEKLISPPVGMIGGSNNAFGLEFNDTDTLALQLVTMDDESYRFWSAYSSMSIGSTMFFYPIYENYPSNMSNGLGYFCGFGSATYVIPLKYDTLINY